MIKFLIDCRLLQAYVATSVYQVTWIYGTGGIPIWHDSLTFGYVLK